MTAYVAMSLVSAFACGLSVAMLADAIRNRDRWGFYLFLVIWNASSVAACVAHQ